MHFLDPSGSRMMDGMEPAPSRDDENELPPWEQPGAVRRDCESHRAGLVKLLMRISIFFTIFAPCCGIPGIPGAAFGLAGWLVARHDLRRMAAGRMDPEGLEPTRDAMQKAIVSMIASIISVAGDGVLLWWFWR